MDPLFVSAPDYEGYLHLSDKVKLHYQVHLQTAFAQPVGRVVMIMGAFALSNHLIETADILKSHGYDVLRYDHRGVGRSGPALAELQTSEMLAEDAAKLIDHVWGLHAVVHVYG